MQHEYRIRTKQIILSINVSSDSNAVLRTLNTKAYLINRLLIE